MKGAWSVAPGAAVYSAVSILYAACTQTNCWLHGCTELATGHATRCFHHVAVVLRFSGLFNVLSGTAIAVLTRNLERLDV